MLTMSVGNLFYMKVGTRLSVAMILCLAPISIAYTVQMERCAAPSSSRDLRDAARTAQRALNASLTPAVELGKWDKARHILSAGAEGSAAALFDESGKLRYASQGFPITVPALERAPARTKSDGAAEFLQWVGGRAWFFRIEPLTGHRGYLLLAQDWSRLHDDRSRRIIVALLADIGFLLASTIGVQLLTRRYVTLPLTELQRGMKNLGDIGNAEQALNRRPVKPGSEEFERVNEQLAAWYYGLLQESERKLHTERRILNGDKLAAIAALASGFAHEIGSPLGVVRGHAELLLANRFDDSELRDSLEAIVEQIYEIVRLVKTLLDVGRRRLPVRVASDVRAIADRTIRLVEPEAVRRGVSMMANLGPAPLMVDCDPDQLQQVFMDLEVNALDAMAPEGGILRVNSCSDDGKGKVRLSFEDSGPGVPSAIRDRIFDPFFTTKGQGTGMGLAISKSVIGEHEGSLTLEEHAQGACFVITLPASKQLEPAHQCR